ncbi:AraC-like DNA-binding protein [Rhizobium leguminosarum]|uniref:helix-turn-helix domain-containing protein n=1 Tax=Rhizobium leguminosarum TaxID=384 RepID=UPI0016185E01|nr:helix-turn-helix domain-containing protein [Rhizobium leguminosarum]MBB5663675.1 AraC-like DNA-binding protein [Rhizobium leguminosarum]
MDNNLDVSQGEWLGSPRAFTVERHVADTMASAHWHDHIEVNLLLEGSMTYLFNGKQEFVEAGHLVLFWAAIPHQTIFVTPESPLICIYLPLVDFLALPIDAASRQAVLQGAFISEVETFSSTSAARERWVDDWLKGDNARRQLVKDETSIVVRRLMLDHVRKRAAPPPVPKLSGPEVKYAQVLTELISRQYSEKLTLPSIARHAHVHPTTANRAFRSVLGISVMEYLGRYRLARAMQRLAETDDPILNIMNDCGFGSTARFYDAFKKQTGMTPRQYRISARPL